MPVHRGELVTIPLSRRIALPPGRYSVYVELSSPIESVNLQGISEPTPEGWDTQIVEVK